MLELKSLIRVTEEVERIIQENTHLKHEVERMRRAIQKISHQRDEAVSNSRRYRQLILMVPGFPE